MDNKNHGITGPVQKQEAPVVHDILRVEVRDPDKLVFSGNAVAISSRNSVGPFDVLPQHENFISIINGKIIIYLDKKHTKQEIQNETAIMKAKSNTVKIFLGVESLGKDEQLVKNPGLTGGIPQKDTASKDNKTKH